ncbi:MAG: glycosyltransferase family 1 protein [Candidatus Dormiibacterota bacterium]
MASRTLDDRTVLLYYREPSHDRFFPYDRHLRRALRPVYNLVRRDQRVSGFFVWYQRLTFALRRAGYRVVCNDVGLARRHPDHPVGLVGYPVVLDGWDLPNPAVLGPALFDHPAQAPELMRDERFRRYLVTAPWMHDLFAPAYGDRLGDWYAGIDTDEWADARTTPKSVDVLVYDKIRWRREHYEPALLDPILAQLRQRGLRVETVRYGQYEHDAYRRLLQRSRAIVFLCEHETQGLAYQEALACNVPMLAWDQGLWLDPNRVHYTNDAVPATSVPYFSPECGERFRDAREFEERFDAFWAGRDAYEPRAYVQRELSPEGSARRYLDYYEALLPGALGTTARRGRA